ncbi:MAG: hypothetical protein IJC19_08700 [Clostridia bacterium]|nr:hypothetical protein [Clostridia bacterium]
MNGVCGELLEKIDLCVQDRKDAIRNAPDRITVSGTSYFVSNDGDDRFDGLSALRPWKTLARVSLAELHPGDGVFFRRGDVFRGFVATRSGVTYAAYGEGEKPKFYGWDKSLANPSLWELRDEPHHIWKWKEPILDCGTLVFNEGEFHSRKLIPSYINGRFVCREDESRPFDPAREMTRDLDIVCFYEERMNTNPSKGQDFPVPQIDDHSFGSLYLRCDRGNPGDVFSSVEALPRRNLFQVRQNDHVTINNLCIKYAGAHAIGAGGSCVKGLHVSDCEIGWVGGSIQHYLGTDPNYPQGGRGTVTRYGNGVEVYGGCDGYTVENCYIYQVYDAAITHQVTTNGKIYLLNNIRYVNNLVEYCVYSIEYFLEKNGGDRDSCISDCEISGNILRFSGYGWGQQRHNTDTPAHIKGWSYENTARTFTIHDNIFDRAAYRMLHLVAKEQESLPVLSDNTYVQTLNRPLGQYGANSEVEPPIMPFDGSVEQTLQRVFAESNPTVIFVEE